MPRSMERVQPYEVVTEDLHVLLGPLAFSLLTDVLIYNVPLLLKGL